MDDLISRQAAIEAIDRYYKDKRYITRSRTILSAICRDMKSTMDSLPSAQPEQRWIPCSERLPEDEQPILFSTTTGRVHQGRFHRDNSVNRWYSSLDKMRAYNNVVNAWMPLPEPYKEDGHD